MIQLINYNTTNIQLPTAQRNYTIFDKNKVDSVVAQKEQALPQLKQILATSQDEKQIVETLYIVDRMIDNGTKGIPAMYPILARFNNTQSPNIQSFLAGIYRKTQVPDAFGPLIAMLIRNSLKNPSPPAPLPQGARVACENPTTYANVAHSMPADQAYNPPIPPFDSNEEIGGAILEYIKNYSNNPKKIDYTA